MFLYDCSNNEQISTNSCKIGLILARLLVRMNNYFSSTGLISSEIWQVLILSLKKRIFLDECLKKNVRPLTEKQKKSSKVFEYSRDDFFGQNLSGKIKSSKMPLLTSKLSVSCYQNTHQKKILETLSRIDLAPVAVIEE